MRRGNIFSANYVKKMNVLNISNWEISAAL